MRFDRQAGPRTRIVAVTPGILLRQLQDDSFLESTGVVVFDEFHERGLESDLALGMVRLIQQTVRAELRIVVMSATLAGESVAAYLDGCPIVASEGRLHPVTIRYQPRPPKEPLAEGIVAAVVRCLDQTAGDLLVFLPGVGEIRQAARALEALAEERNLAVLPLYGDLPPEQQDAALLPQGRRKVVLATNVAETSVTVDGVTAVIDSGLARELQYDPAVGLDRLKLTPISRASADQRPAGRGGPRQESACGCGASCRIGAGRSRPIRKSAAWTWPARCCNCWRPGKRTCCASPGWNPRPRRRWPRRSCSCAGWGRLTTAA